MIEVKDLVKRYGSHTAVDHLSFHVEKGQIYGFLGPNGAGKSTTMNIMTGYLAATDGNVIIRGCDIRIHPEKAKRSIGYLPEVPPLYTDMTVFEYLKFVSELKKIQRKDRHDQICRAMELTKITDMADRLIKNLSKGYKQRVGMAQAVLGDPEVLILDEPTAGLDPKQIMEMRDLIRDLKKEHTVILSSHILSEVSAVCDHIMIMSHGRLAASGSPEELKTLRSRNMRLEICVKGGITDVREALDEIEEITAIQEQEGAQEGCCRMILQSEDNQDIRERLFYVLAGKKLPLMEMRLLEQSLEDIFLELTEEQEEVQEADGHDGNL